MRKHDWALMDCDCHKEECMYYGCTACGTRRNEQNMFEECKKDTEIRGDYSPF